MVKEKESTLKIGSEIEPYVVDDFVVVRVVKTKRDWVQDFVVLLVVAIIGGVIAGTTVNYLSVSAAEPVFEVDDL